MRFVNEYRDRDQAKRLREAIAAADQSAVLMEVCGGQTHTIMRYGIDQMLPDAVTMIHGPGCPVCVTSVKLIDQALAIAARPEVIFTSFGDMLRVPGTELDLFTVKARGGDVRIVYSPLDAVALARDNPDRQVVFFGVGFETTAPANAMAVWQAAQQGLGNFSILAAHVLVPPAMEAILSSPDCRVQGFLAAGHVCTIMGYWQYEPIAERYKVPIVVTGFEPNDLLQGIHMAVEALKEGRHGVFNQYARSVRREGNKPAQDLVAQVFEAQDQGWRGIGTIPMSGLRLSEQYASFDAVDRFDVGGIVSKEAAACRAGEVLQGHIRPMECEAFGKECTPDMPLGAPMVSSEGACSAYYRYRRET